MENQKVTNTIMSKKLLIIGGSGLVGSTLTNYALPNFDIITTYNKNKNNSSKTPSVKIDLLNQSSKMINLIESSNPDIVVNTAAYPSVDFCETHPEMADKLHVGVTKEIANICDISLISI